MQRQTRANTHRSGAGAVNVSSDKWRRRDALFDATQQQQQQRRRQPLKSEA